MHINDRLLEAARDGDLAESIRCLNDGAEVDCTDEDGYTPLMQAAWAGNLPLVTEFVKRGANPDHWAQGDCPLSCAASGGWRPIFAFLQEFVSDDTYAAVGQEQLELGERRRRRAENPATEDFIMAAAQGNLEAVKDALASGASVNALGSHGNSALHYASFYGHVPAVKLLLDADAHVNVKSDDSGPGSVGSTPLALVAGSFFASDRIAVIETLLAAGADIDTRDHDGSTPLMHAVCFQSGYPDSIRALISGGADLDLRDPNGNTALMMAIVYKREEIIGLLRQAGASEKGVESVYLQRAASDGDFATVQRLLSEGKANLNHRYHHSALSVASMYGHASIVAALLKGGADVNLRDASVAFTPLIHAANGGHLEVVQLLLEAGADMTAQVEGIGTALDYARQYRSSHGKVIELLEAAGTPSIWD